MAEPKTLFDQFKFQRDVRGEETAFLIGSGDRPVPISWRKFTDEIEEIAFLVQKYMPGATIGLLGENSYEWMTAHVACTFGGACVVPLEMGLSPEEIAERLVFVGARLLVHSALQKEKAKAVKRLLPDLIVEGFGSRMADRMLAYAAQQLAGGEKGVFSQPQRNEDDTAMIVFTSGTTSKPRGAELTLHGIRAFSDFASSQLQIKAGSRSLMLLPLHHIFGVCTTYMMLAHGVALGVCPDFRRIYESVERFRANFLFLVPALAELLAMKISKHGESAEEVLGAPLEWILTGGAPCPQRTQTSLMSLGIRPLGGYGLTETTSLYSISPLDDSHLGCAGMACGGKCEMETRVSKDGILQIRGPSVMKGYYNDPARTADVLDKDGWFTTGDYGRIDEDGTVWITGRASRTIILSSGKKVAPEELEEKLMSLPGVREVLVSGDLVSREVKAEIYAVVSEETVRRQIDIVNRSLPLYKRIREIVVRSEPFPRTASGKIKVSSTISASAADSRAKGLPRHENAEGAQKPPPRAAATAASPARKSPFVGAMAVGRGISRLAIRRWKWVVAVLAAMSGAVLLWNVFGSTVLDSLPVADKCLKKVVSIVGEGGEFVLALLVLIAAIVVWLTVFRTKSGGGDGQDEDEG